MHLKYSNLPRTLEVGFYLVPGYSLTGFSVAIDPLQVANRLSGKSLYNYSVLTCDGKGLKSSCGIKVDADGAPHNMKIKFDLVIICAGVTDPADLNSRTLHDWIRKLASIGCELGAISTGSEILAKAGVLDGYRCTIHWENEESFRETYPRAQLTGGIYELDKQRITAAGGIASLDMILSWIANTSGKYLASAIAEQFVHDHTRIPSQRQRNAESEIIQRRSPKLAKAMQLMVANIEDILPSGEIANRVGISKRQLERLFSKYRQKTLHQYYLETRLEKSRNLIMHTTMSLMQISIATGFSSQSHFTRCYKKLFDRTPSSERAG